MAPDTPRRSRTKIRRGAPRLAMPHHLGRLLRRRRRCFIRALSEVGEGMEQAYGEGLVQRPVGVLQHIQRGYLQLVQKASVPRIRIHDTRHTHVTLAVLAGAQLGAVSKRVGHARTSTTADLYAHILPEMQAEVAARINAALFSSRPGQPPVEPR